MLSPNARLWKPATDNYLVISVLQPPFSAFLITLLRKKGLHDMQNRDAFMNFYAIYFEYYSLVFLYFTPLFIFVN